MAAALLVATHERADALGIPPERRVYLRGWCYATDPVLVAARPQMWRSPAMAAAASNALAARGHRHRRRRAPRPLLVLRELVALRVRRARDLAARHARADRHRRPAVPRRSGERLPRALDRQDGRRVARRSRCARCRERRRHAHDQARVRRVLDDTRRSSLRRTKPRCSATSTRSRAVTGRRRARRRRRRSPRTRSCTAATARPSRPCSCATPDGARTYARLDGPRAGSGGRDRRARRRAGPARARRRSPGRWATPVSTWPRPCVDRPRRPSSLTGRRPVRTLPLYTPPL